jgi:putative copper resistance protein D
MAAKAVTYAATLSAAGTVCFLAYSHDLIETSIARDIRRSLRTLLIVSTVASCAKVSATAASMSGDPAGLIDLGLMRMILQAGEGRASLVRLIGVILMVPALAGCRRPPLSALIGAALAATSFAWVGHVHALAQAWLPAVLALHLMGVAFWLGALVPLLMVCGDAAASRVAATASRFGASALFVVGVLLAAGACLLSLLLHDASELTTSAYGRFVSFKIVLVAWMLALAALNHLRLTPRLFAGDTRALSALRRSIRFEIALACVILFVTAAMTTLTGPAAQGLD